MLPLISMHNISDGRGANVKNFPQASHRVAFGTIEFSDLDHLNFGQFCRMVPQAGVSAMSNAILHICLPCVPAQVGKRTVGGITIVVTGFHSIGAGPDKGRKDQSTNRKNPSFASGKRNAQGSFGSVPMRTKDPLGGVFYTETQLLPLKSPVRPHSPLVADLVARKIRNIFPNFVRDVKVAFSHGVTLLIRVGAEVRAVAVIPSPLRLIFYTISSDTLP